jgi:membrane protein
MSNLRALASEFLNGLSKLVQDFFERSPAHVRTKQLLLALDRHLTLRTASAMAFDLFLAIVPLLGVAGYAASILLRSRPEALVEGSQLLDLAPTRLHDFIVHNVTAFAETEVAPLFVFLVLWTSSAAFLTMIRVFEDSFGCEPRSWLKARLLALCFAASGFALFILATAAGAILTWYGAVPDKHKLRIGELMEFSPDSLNALREFHPIGVIAPLASVLGIVLYLAFIYRFAVIRKDIRRRFFPGAIAATAIGLIGSFLFAYYATNLSRYALYYGSLVAIVVVLLWLWLWCTAILIGAEINVALEGDCPPAGRPDAAPASAATDHGVGIEPAGPTQTPSAMGKPDGD